MGLSKYKKDLLRNFVNYCCGICGKHEDEVGTLETHRIQRGNSGGLYILPNIKMVCSEDHKKIHGDEF